MSVTILHESTHVDKSTWGEGPWQSEPDKVQWKDEATGYACLAVRQPRSGHWCGYVAVTEGHPSFEKHYEDVVEPSTPEADEYLSPLVHGGLTYSDFCQEGEDVEEQGICHIPQPGEPERVWWFGFDCAHLGDMSPGARSRLREMLLVKYGAVGFPDPVEEYRTLEYVQEQCAELACQLREIATAKSRE